MPGHKLGALVPDSISPFLGASMKLDLTELPGLDNLHAAAGCILESQMLAARASGSDHCFYSVNGSTAGVMAAIASVAGPGENVLFLNRFHLSAWRGLALCGANPVFIPPRFSYDDWEFGFPTADEVVARIRSFDGRIKAAFLTSPTYSGRVADVAKMAEVVHQEGIPLVVDEAHGAHLGIVPGMPKNSVQAGADIVIQSVHKMLPGLTQTAWVHSQGKRVAHKRVSEWLGFLQSTSPSYLLMASLDAAQAWLRHDARAVMEKGLVNLQAMQAKLADCLRRDQDRDPFKSFVPIGSASESERLVSILANRGIELEFADGFGALGIHRLDAPLKQLMAFADGVLEWMESYSGSDENMSILRDMMVRFAVPELLVSPREAQLGDRKSVGVQNSVGHLLATMIVPYPPGVPLAWPGQRVGEDLREAILTALEMGFNLSGVGPDGTVSVLSRA